MSFSLIPSNLSLDSAKSKTAAKVIAWIVGLGSAAILAPLIFLALQGLLGLVAALAVGTLALRLAPWFGTFTSNLGLKLLKIEARRNPIETMQNIYLQRNEAANEAEKQIKAFNNKVTHYCSQVSIFVKKYPSDAERFRVHHAAMQELLNRKYSALRSVRAKLVEYQSGIERASAIWDMTQASDDLSKAAGLLSEKDAIQQIKHDEALKSVEEGMARSFAELDHILKTEVDEFQLSTDQTIRMVPNQQAERIALTPNSAFGGLDVTEIHEVVPVEKKV